MTSAYEEGDPSSKLCIIGEAPAKNEIRLSRPFVGQSGYLLDQLLHSAGIARRECYLLNVWPFEVEKRGNNVYHRDTGEYLFGAQGFTEAGRGYTKECADLLGRCLANTLVSLGNIPLCYLTGKVQITKWRGSILNTSNPDLGVRKFVPTIHPAAILRGQYILRYPVISDLKRAKRESRYPEIRPPERTYRLDPSFGETLDYLAECLSADRVAFDLEVYNHQISCISFALTASDVMSIPLVWEGTHRWTLDEEVEIWSKIQAVLENPKSLKIGQNLIFDTWFLLAKNGIHTRGEIGDTMVAHHIIYPDFPKGLDFLCSTYTEEPYYKDDGKIWKKISIDPLEFALYNAKDSVVCFEMWPELEKELREKGFWGTYHQTVMLYEPLLYMMLKGIRVDSDRLADTKREVESNLVEKEAQLLAVAEWDFNPLSPKQCQQYCYGTKGIKPYLSHKTGAITTDDKAMVRIVRRYNLPEARLVQEIRNLKKLLGTYLNITFDKDGRIRCSYNTRGTTTGRLSSSKTIFGTGMNLQNLGPRFKGFLVADGE